jgi:hypothetical protein
MKINFFVQNIHLAASSTLLARTAAATPLVGSSGH